MVVLSLFIQFLLKKQKNNSAVTHIWNNDTIIKFKILEFV